MKIRVLGLPSIFCFAVAWTAGCLLILESQSARIETILRDDFRVILFLESELPESRQKVLEEKLWALPHVQDVRIVSKQEALSALRREDPELVAAVSLLNDNPLNPAYEIQIDDGGFGGLPRWIERVEELAEWSDIRYKAGQAQAVLQVKFFRHFLSLTLNLLACAAAFLVLILFWEGPRFQDAFPGAGVSVLAAAAGWASACLTVWPMRLLSSWWQWPSWDRQALMVGGAALCGWMLCGRKE